MIVMSVSMGAFIGLPPSLIETYGTDVKKVYKANGIPLHVGLITMFLSTFFHLMISCVIILLLATVLFDAASPKNIPLFLLALAVYAVVSLSIGSILGLVVKSQAKVTMICSCCFCLPLCFRELCLLLKYCESLKILGRIFPATWGYRLMLDNGFHIKNLWYLIIVFVLLL